MSGAKGGVDLGGTKIQAVILDGANEVLGQARHPTPTTGGPEAVAAAIVETLLEAAGAAGLEASELTAVGVGSPGAVDPRTGVVASARNLPGWDSPFPLGPTLQAALDTKVALGNDVQVGIEGEFALGAGQGFSSLLGVFWGTGVGGGLVLDRRPWLGRGAAGEIGHMVVRKGGAVCPCGRRGCMEAYAGRAAMEARARALVKEGERTELFEIMEERGRTRLQSGVWARALKREDPMAVALVDRAVRALGAGIASAVNLLDVEAVVIGGGLGTRLGAPYVKRIEEAMGPHLFVSERPPTVALAALGDLGGAIGAALLAEAT
ncbi:MAG TPA: ROK family protein [Thermoleophilaceae bacterium]|nr:ROK family protein [Thermoleophilaceae bacterium]